MDGELEIFTGVDLNVSIISYILKKHIEDVVTKITSIWKSVYGLSTREIIKKGEWEATNTTKEVQVKDGNVEGTKETLVKETIVDEEQKNVQDV